MLFNSLEFILLFVPIVLGLYLFVLKYCSVNKALGVLFAASIFFYGYWDVRFVPLLLISILCNYVLSLIMRSQTQVTLRRLVMVAGITFNLSILFYYKYALFVFGNIQTWTGFNAGLGNIILPIGLSFFTFQQIAYLVDVYQSRTTDRSFLHYGLFVCFFPQLIAGPIVHHAEMIPQFHRLKLDRVLHNIAIGLTIFCIGLAKKVILADSLALYSSPLFDGVAAGGSISFFAAWGAALTYTFQLYFDFSGYSDMAIGLARMFGVVLPINFSSPYKSRSIIEFWRRWHMTLSRFLRDYLYVPLGGNRKGAGRRYVNVILTMILGGVWHGAGWTFIVWGAMHAAALSLNHLWFNLGLKWRLHGLASWAVLFTFLVVSWVPFRAADLSVAMDMWEAMAGLNGVAVPIAFSDTLREYPHLTAALGLKPVGVQVLNMEWLLVILTGLSVGLLMPNSQTIMRDFAPGITAKGYPTSGILVVKLFENLRWRPTLKFAALTAVIFALSIIWGNDVSEFIYFKF